MRAPAHMRAGPGRGHLHRMRAEGRDLARYYGGRIYLVGSALLDFNADPRDWDIRIILTDGAFARRYGPPGPLKRRAHGYVATWEWIEQANGQWEAVRHKWAADCVKRSKECSRRLGLNVDLQVQPETYADVERAKGGRKYRLDRAG